MSTAGYNQDGGHSPPAFQMYATNRLADRNFKAMTAAERGLLHTLELELWVNGPVPADIADMARTIGMERSEVEAAFTWRVQRFLERRETPEKVWISPTLEHYRQELADRRQRMSDGGRKGADHANRERRARAAASDGRASDHPDGHPDDHPDGHPAGALSRAKQSTSEASSKAVYREAGNFLRENDEVPF